MEVKELEIKVPWGHIAVKLFGNEKDDPILCSHGIFDNLGSLERLIALLPPTYYYICFDLPSHGNSSPWPKYTLINVTDLIIAYKILVDYFKRRKYIFLGHSLGGVLTIFFSHAYPEHVKKIILLDVIFCFTMPPLVFKTMQRRITDSYIKTMKTLETKSPPELTYDEAIEKIRINRSSGEICKEAAEPLVKRVLVPLKNGKFTLNIDQRLKFYYNPLITLSYIEELIRVEPITCPVLLILATGTKLQLIRYYSILKYYRSLNNFSIRMVEGNHDVHNNEPEKVAPLVEDFLKLESSKL